MYVLLGDRIFSCI